MKDAYGLDKRTCSWCFVTKPLTEYRVRKDGRSGGFFAQCAECSRKSCRESKARYDKRQTPEQREKLRARARERYQERKKAMTPEERERQREVKRKRDAIYNQRATDARAKRRAENNLEKKGTKTDGK